LLANRHHNNTSKRTRKTTTTTTITFRIDTDTINKLRTESARNDRSLNTSVNQILKRYVQWDMFEPQAGIIPFAKPVVTELLANMSKDHITNLAVCSPGHYGSDERKDRFRFILRSFLAFS
jgi:hypothetical protein